MSDRKPKILVVDDDPFVRDLLAFILQSRDYDVVTAENGAEALETYAKAPEITMIISDMNMPEMDGLQLLGALRENKDDIPIIILTANNEISVALEAIDRGANDYLLKDENIQETVLHSVGKVMEKHQLKVQNIKLMEDLTRKNRELREFSRKLINLTKMKEKQHEELKQSYSKIKTMQEKLIEAERRSMFAAVVVTANHEIMQPLSVLLLKLNMLEDKMGDQISERERTSLDKAKEAVFRIKKILKNLKEIENPDFTEYLEGVRMVDLKKYDSDG